MCNCSSFVASKRHFSIAVHLLSSQPLKIFLFRSALVIKSRKNWEWHQKRNKIQWKPVTWPCLGLFSFFFFFLAFLFSLRLLLSNLQLHFPAIISKKIPLFLTVFLNLPKFYNNLTVFNGFSILSIFGALYFYGIWGTQLP